MKKLAFILPFLFLFTPLFAQAALTDNILSYWKFDENTGTTAADATGDGYTATLHAGAGWGSPFLGVSSLSLVSASSQYASFSSVNITSNFTFSAWFKTSYSGAQQAIASDSGAANSLQMKVQTTGALQFFYNISGSNVTINSSGVSTANNGSWHNILVTCVNHGACTLYFDGTNVGSASIAGSGLTTAVTFGVIGELSAGATYFNGLIDEVGIWNRALSSTEITQLYNSGAGLQYPFATAVATPAPARKMRLFEGFKLKLLSDKMILYQQ